MNVTVLHVRSIGTVQIDATGSITTELLAEEVRIPCLRESHGAPVSGSGRTICRASAGRGATKFLLDMQTGGRVGGRSCGHTALSSAKR
jgi:hypothetical protein